MAHKLPDDTCPVCIKTLDPSDRDLESSDKCTRRFYKECIPLITAVYDTYADQKKMWYCNRVNCVNKAPEPIGDKSEVVLNKLSA